MPWSVRGVRTVQGIFYALPGSKRYEPKVHQKQEARTHSHACFLNNYMCEVIRTYQPIVEPLSTNIIWTYIRGSVIIVHKDGKGHMTIYIIAVVFLLHINSRLIIRAFSEKS